MTISPKSTPERFLKGYLRESLLKAPTYSIDILPTQVKLDQNESPQDWPLELKQKVVDHLMSVPWNRYPTAHAPGVTKLLAEHVGLPEECVLTGPGSDHLLTLILNIFTAKMSGTLFLARPSFPLYEMHCRYYEIPYTPWELNADMSYDLDALSSMPKGSVVVFASPNNPTGSVLDSDSFESLLKQHPESLFVADEAYFEFVNKSYISLLNKYSNLILVRTFSKAMASAGIRFGYTLASPELTAQLKKVRTPYILNQLSAPH